MAALDIMVRCHTIALHTREVRELTNVNQYIEYQLKMLFAGLIAEPGTKKKAISKAASKSRR
jgi:hypothetical protein